MKFDLECGSCGYDFKASIDKKGLQRLLKNGNFYFICPECTQEIAKDEGVNIPEGMFSICSEDDF